MLSDHDFAVGFATQAGRRLLYGRRGPNRAVVFDQTVLSDIVAATRRQFTAAVRTRSIGQDYVVGDDRPRNRSPRRVWTVTPLDGAAEYAQPDVPHRQRTSSVGIALLQDGAPVLSVIYCPFRRELYTAKADQPALMAHGANLESESRVRAGSQALKVGGQYDYSTWRGAHYDLRTLAARFGRPPLGTASALYQACQVATGQLACAFYPGNNIEVVAPAALLVTRAGARVRDFQGHTLRWSDLGKGVVYANTASCAEALRALRDL